MPRMNLNVVLYPKKWNSRQNSLLLEINGPRPRCYHVVWDYERPLRRPNLITK
ncbi:hypothetical protein SLEP1_g36714 [Rubroshorea leprosula]|uniref:Uncharacterized protein n=1 Tax=Rubroshorea leprosula TaxID=152421 RepID=A0AAV5KSB5_9ROSI|nr:hypothetical protein SLEP1_g36714 [Rubroshorea leprosula]